jgi:hypothetical protein
MNIAVVQLFTSLYIGGRNFIVRVLFSFSIFCVEFRNLNQESCMYFKATLLILVFILSCSSLHLQWSSYSPVPICTYSGLHTLLFFSALTVVFILSCSSLHLQWSSYSPVPLCTYSGLHTLLFLSALTVVFMLSCFYLHLQWSSYFPVLPCTYSCLILLHSWLDLQYEWTSGDSNFIWRTVAFGAGRRASVMLKAYKYHILI